MLSSENTIIEVKDVSKCYHIWASPLHRLTSPIYEYIAALVPFLPRLRDRLLARAARARHDFYALRNVSFEVERGHSLGIIGRNGSGKSTLLQIITGTLRPTQGEVTVRGRVAALLELGSGFNGEFTGRENVKLNAALLGLSPAQIEERMESILAFAEIGAFVEEPVKTYSSGMMLRLAFAVIAHIDADILIIDEALAVGDVFFVQKCLAFLRRFQETGVLLLVAHDPSTVTTLCDKAIWLNQGNLRREGSPKEVTEAYVEEFHQAEAVAKLGAKAVAAKGEVTPAPMAAATFDKTQPIHDQRLPYLNTTQYRNDLQLFQFDPKAASYGVGGGKIVDVRIEDDQEKPLSWAVGGEVVTLRVRFSAGTGLTQPILGFFVKNHLGQWLFGDNTFLSSPPWTLEVTENSLFEARFRFQMPLLPPGDYSILLGLADGRQEDHVIHHWIHDALVFKSASSSVAGGLVGLPMLEVSLANLGQTSFLEPAEVPPLETIHV